MGIKHESYTHTHTHTHARAHVTARVYIFTYIYNKRISKIRPSSAAPIAVRFPTFATRVTRSLLLRFSMAAKIGRGSMRWRAASSNIRRNRSREREREDTRAWKRRKREERENRRCRCSSAAAAECIGNCDFLRKRYCHEELLRTALTILQPMYPYVSDDKMYPRLRESRTRVCDEYIWYRLLIIYLIRHVSGKFERPLRRTGEAQILLQFHYSNGRSRFSPRK